MSLPNAFQHIWQAKASGTSVHAVCPNLDALSLNLHAHHWEVVVVDPNLDALSLYLHVDDREFIVEDPNLDA